METRSGLAENRDHALSTLDATARILLLLALLSSILVKLVPFYPRMPEAGLDPSWMYAVNEAVARGLSFGQDIVWVHGPMASVYTHAYHPATYALTVIASLYLALSYWAILVAFMKESHWLWLVAIAVALVALRGDPDPLLFTLPLLIGLLTLRAVRSGEDSWLDGRLAPLYAVALFAPLGLLPLIKGSLLPLCALVSIACAVLLVANRRWWLAPACVVAPVVVFVAFWSLSAQSVNAVADYITSTTKLTAGWAQGMGFTPVKTGRGAIYLHLEVISYVVASAGLLAVVLSRRDRTAPPKVFAGALYAAILFLAFKAGFVIHDEHAVIAGETVLLVALLIASQVRISRAVVLVTALALCAFLLPEVHYIYLLDRGMPGTGYVAAWKGISKHALDPGWLGHDFDQAVDSLRDEAGFPVLEGTSDIYSYDQSYLIASGNDWSPRPILQSHTAYTPTLARMDLQYLLGRNAPKNVFFSVQPIFGRLPALEDGPSWPILMRAYRPERIYNDHLVLQEREDAGPDDVLRALPKETHRLGETVRVPETTGTVFARVSLEPTLMGRLANALYKPAELRITLELADGTIKEFVLVAGMADAGFVISPLVENTDDFRMLCAGDARIDSKQVRAIRVDQADLDGRVQTRDWRDDYSVRFSLVGEVR